MFNSSFRIVGINLVGLLGLAVALRTSIPNGRESIAYAVQMLVLIGAQVLANTVLAIATKKKERQRAYWLSVLLVLLVGFGACAGGLMLY